VTPPARAITPATLGAWVVKASPAEDTVAELARRGFSTDWTSCLRPTYRADLDPSTPAGVHARGVTAGPAAYDGSQVRVPLRLEPVVPPVLRAEMLDHLVLRGAEVLRMPTGSNPSYLTLDELAALEEGWPQLRR
jgi:hypothetical protein